MSDDLISRQAAIDALTIGEELLKRALDQMYVVGNSREKYEFGLGLIESCIAEMKDLPSAQRKKGKCISGKCVSGKWIAVKVGNGDTRYTCSECGASYECDSRDRWDFNFCPNCGAEMSERRTDDDND